MEGYEIPKANKRYWPILKLVAAVVLVTALVTLVYYVIKVNKAASSESREVNILVEKGMRTKQVAYLLQDKNVISSANIFLIYSSLHSAGGKIQAGQYVLNANMTIAEIIDILTHGKVVSDERTLTIVEGWSNKQIGSYLTKRQINDFDLSLDENYDFKFGDLAQEFSYEGFLFPDTYKLAAGEASPSLIKKMLNNFENKMTDDLLNDISAKKRNLKDVLILASIVEKEVGRNKPSLTQEDLDAMHKERLLVASVFYNRLQIGMALESDATVNYVTGKSDRSVSIADTKINSPYNTYQHRGLPPTPIGNPGIDAIGAAISPAQTDYLYFLNAPDGTAYFAKTLAEHSANRAKYLK